MNYNKTDVFVTDDIPFRLADVIVKPATNELIINNEVKRIEDKLMKVLIYLASRHDVIVSREELFENIWPDIYVSQASLNRCISILRKLLNDDSGQPRIIQTVRNRGYRIICGVKPNEDTTAVAAKKGFTFQTGFREVVNVASGILTILVTAYLMVILSCLL